VGPSTRTASLRLPRSPGAASFLRTQVLGCLPLPDCLGPFHPPPPFPLCAPLLLSGPYIATPWHAMMAAYDLASLSMILCLGCDPPGCPPPQYEALQLWRFTFLGALAPAVQVSPLVEAAWLAWSCSRHRCSGQHSQ
jgi:hypothetical protein